MTSLAASPIMLTIRANALRDRATYASSTARKLAVEIMETSAADTALIRQLEAAGRNAGAAADHLNTAACILEALARGPE